MRIQLFLASFQLMLNVSSAFLTTRSTVGHPATLDRSFLSASTLDSAQIERTTQAVDKLKKVLNREYVSFFDPMQKEYYSQGVSFDDPMTSLSGVDAYQNNVDMLASRTLMGKFLFQDGGIVLHSITGGEVQPDGSISDIITRWTLRVTVKVLPWQPTARFSGISVYEVSPGGSEGVLVDHQTDYWDSINIQQGGDYTKVDKGIAIKDFLDQLKPDNGNAAAAGVEMPYQLLRRGKDYEVRRYPAYNAATIPYDRRDEGYDLLATITKGIEPLTPAIMEVPDDNSQKTMSWPLNFAPPGQTNPPAIPQSVTETARQPMWKDCELGTVDSKVIAVGSFADASVAPVVRKADAKLRAALRRDGISVPDKSDSVKFAQYDAIFTLGKRRGEVWIELEDGTHPWSE
jgi:Uncharacterized conserved protein (DUF2358)/SOUL heme-binding protein